MEEKEKIEKQEKQERQDEKINDQVNKQVEEKIKKIVEVGVQSDNVDYLYKLVDIHKDLANEDYWKCKKEVMKMRYRGDYGTEEYGAGEYGNYGRRMRDDRGRYMARGYDTKYRGEEMIDDMRDMYGEYSENKEEYGRGNYRAKDDTMKSLDDMLQSVVDFMRKLQDEADSPEEVELVKKYAKKIGMM